MQVTLSRFIPRFPIFRPVRSLADRGPKLALRPCGAGRATLWCCASPADSVELLDWKYPAVIDTATPTVPTLPSITMKAAGATKKSWIGSSR